MKLTQPDIASFAIAKAYMVPLIDLYGREDKKSQNDIFDGISMAFTVLARIAKSHDCSVREIIEELLEHFNNSEELISNFLKAYSIACEFVNLDRIFGGRAKNAKNSIISNAKVQISEKNLKLFKEMLLFFNKECN